MFIKPLLPIPLSLSPLPESYALSEPFPDYCQCDGKPRNVASQTVTCVVSQHPTNTQERRAGKEKRYSPYHVLTQRRSAGNEIDKVLTRAGILTRDKQDRLIQAYNICKYPTQVTKAMLGLEIGMSVKKIDNFFKSRRFREKKSAK